MYYGLINLFGELVYRLSDRVIKVRYEDFIRDPQKVVDKILDHVDPGGFKERKIPVTFEMPHIVGGNRMKSQKTVSIYREPGWRLRMGRSKQLLYYIMVWPIMALNGYRP